ncbi:hypothetical protein YASMINEVIRUS_127 [Yasminevirus sp. GU-2018]|uniref:C2H2-type domain-containing protein n=1 Tax=Yasminevirus sp. GU-2018 TaxID=2420051 RepID=A0A5K0U837_9VIRU|nr:hypothetical protein YASMINEVIRUS_127 [Yasminevirus sp. GU-2018]
MSFLCDNCDKSFERKANLEYHIKQKVCEGKQFKCKYCDNTFSSKCNVYRHMSNNCKVKKGNDEEKEDILSRLLALENEVSVLKTTNKKLITENKKLKVVKKVTNNNTVNKIDKSTTNNNTNNNTNNGIVINNNITLVGYGKEDLSKLNRSELLKILQNGYHSTIKLTEAVHFNPKFPEYHNVFISNMKDKYAMMFDGKNWTLTTKDDLINKIYDDKKNYIEENLEVFVDSLSPSRKNALERWLETDDEDAKIKEIKENIKLLLYNQRKMIGDVQPKKTSKKVIKDD